MSLHRGAPGVIYAVSALLGAVFIGVALGLLGSGGAIITVPILVYLVGHGEKQAIAESLAIVGFIALCGAARAGAKRQIDARSVFYFGFPGLLGTYLGSEASRFVAGELQVALLGALMLAAAALMFRAARPPQAAAEAPPDRAPAPQRAWLLAAQGIGVGAITGLLGVGGGFMIVPALVLLGRVPMRIAVGTSLTIIAINCAVGFAKHLHILHGAEEEVNWRIIALFGALGAAGGLLGGAIGGKLNQSTLKRLFAVFLVLMAVYILWRQIPEIGRGIGSRQ